MLTWIGVMSLWAFSAMGYDKRQAQKKGARISEKTLWLLACVGGGIGAYLGMQVFRHKTRRTAFRVGFLMLGLVYTMIIVYLLGVEIPDFTRI